MQRPDEENRPIPSDAPVWRETPLDHWSRDIDPVIMSGDEWVEENDPGTQVFDELMRRNGQGSMFMHPSIDTNYGVYSDIFVSSFPDYEDPDAE